MRSAQRKGKFSLALKEKKMKIPSNIHRNTERSSARIPGAWLGRKARQMVAVMLYICHRYTSVSKCQEKARKQLPRYARGQGIYKRRSGKLIWTRKNYKDGYLHVGEWTPDAQAITVRPDSRAHTPALNERVLLPSGVPTGLSQTSVQDSISHSVSVQERAATLTVPTGTDGEISHLVAREGPYQNLVQESGSHAPSGQGQVAALTVPTGNDGEISHLVAREGPNQNLVQESDSHATFVQERAATLRYPTEHDECVVLQGGGDQLHHQIPVQESSHYDPSLQERAATLRVPTEHDEYAHLLWPSERLLFQTPTRGYRRAPSVKGGFAKVPVEHDELVHLHGTRRRLPYEAPIQESSSHEQHMLENAVEVRVPTEQDEREENGVEQRLLNRMPIQESSSHSQHMLENAVEVRVPTEQDERTPV